MIDHEKESPSSNPGRQEIEFPEHIENLLQSGKHYDAGIALNNHLVKTDDSVEFCALLRRGQELELLTESQVQRLSVEKLKRAFARYPERFIDDLRELFPVLAPCAKLSSTYSDSPDTFVRQLEAALPELSEPLLRDYAGLVYSLREALMGLTLDQQTTTRCSILSELGIEPSSEGCWQSLSHSFARSFTYGEGNIELLRETLRSLNKTDNEIGPILFQALRLRVTEALEPRAGNGNFESVKEFIVEHGLVDLDPSEIVMVANSLRGCSSQPGAELAQLLPAELREQVLYNEMKPASTSLRDANTLALEQEVMIIHAIPTNEQRVRETKSNNTAVDHSKASLTGRIVGALCAPELSCSSRRLGETLKSTTYATGLIVIAGQVASAYPTDAYSVVDPDSGLKVSKDRDRFRNEDGVQSVEAISTTTGLAVNYRAVDFPGGPVNILSKWLLGDRYNELLVREFEIGGIFIDGVAFPDLLSELDTLLNNQAVQELQLPIYVDTSDGLKQASMRNQERVFADVALDEIYTSRVTIDSRALQLLQEQTKDFWNPS